VTKFENQELLHRSHALQCSRSPIPDQNNPKMPTAHRTDIILRPNSRRVLIRALQILNEQRVRNIVARVLTLDADQIHTQLDQVFAEFKDRHQHVAEFFETRFESLRQYVPTDSTLSSASRQLIGAYFTQEYALEAAALFNPSMVWHPDNSNLPSGHRRFILSLRATGEGHISSVVFRSGIVGPNGEIALDPSSRFVAAPEQMPDTRYHRSLFARKLQELGWWNGYAKDTLENIPEWFTIEELRRNMAAIARADRQRDRENANVKLAIETLALSNYEIRFRSSQELSERVLFPISPTEVGGMEDARFVEFTDEDGSKRYYGTYTAYDGRTTMPQIIETCDFLHFKMSTLNGPEVHNKGMALFPRKVNGRFLMLSRQDNENIFLMASDDIHFWHEKSLLLRPSFPWEFVQLGNCGSPIETDAGWLVLSHGVGPMRKYSIGAFLLDKDDPSKVIGRLAEPLVTPNEGEREGYVPNVVYSCGAQIHEGLLILPFAMSDSASTFATVDVNELLSEMRPV
jgi:predicted GH43/DUF377 family glycosyl hydrolase